MKNRRMPLQVLLAIAIVSSLIVPAAAVGASEVVPQPRDCPVGYSAADSSSAALAMTLNTYQGNVTPMVAAGGSHTVGLKADSTVVAVGDNEWGQCDVGSWADIVQVAAGYRHTAGLKSDGTVVAVGYNEHGRCDVGGWTDIIQVAAGNHHTVGLKSDGTVVAVGYNYYGQCDVGGWTDIVQVAAGYSHTVGLESDGTMVAVGEDDNGQCNVGGWTDIVQVAAGYSHTVGLKNDGTVIAVGSNGYGQCNVGGWTDIVQVAADHYHTVGLKSDGTVVAVGENNDGQCEVGGWTDVVQVAAGYDHTVGLKSDGTVVAAGPGAGLDKWKLGVTVYDLAISSTTGGSITTPSEGIHTYTPRRVVNLVAKPEEGYRFVRWTGDVSTIGNVNAASTTIAMRDSYSITANFAIPPIQYNLTIASTTKGSVAAPGEGTFSYEEGSVVNLVAESDRGYNFLVWSGDVDSIANVNSALTTISLDADYSIAANFQVSPMVAAGGPDIVGLKSDGTVVSVGCGVTIIGLTSYGNRESIGASGGWDFSVVDWKDIVKVARGSRNPIGLKFDGTVVAQGWNYYGQCDVGGWTNIIEVTGGSQHTVGLCSNGTVVAAGLNTDGQCDVGGWTDIRQVATGLRHTVGLKDNGGVVAVGSNEYGQCNIDDWTDIIQVAAGGAHTAGLRSDGTVVAVGYSYHGQCDVDGWTDIVQVAAAELHTVGLKSDGTVVAVGAEDTWACNVDDWTDIVQVAAGSWQTVGLKSDGTVAATGRVGGYPEPHEIPVIPWNLGVIRYGLTTSSTAGGSLTTPGEGIYTYSPRMIVNLVAEPEEGYRFVRWTGDVSTVGNVNAASTTINMQHDYSITANFAIPPIQYYLTTASTAGGSVTTPGEGTSSYDEGTGVALVAKPEKGYRFLGWTGQVDTIADIDATSTTINVDGDYSIKANFVDVDISNAGIKAGDWIKLEYTITGWPAGQPWSEWLELEFISVEGTSASVNVTLGMSDGQELSDTVPVNLGEGGGEAFGLSGFVIPPNLRRGDSIYFSGYGDVTIEGETTRTYAGVRRRVVYASLSQSVPYQDAVQLTYYWDKQTGVMMEASTIWGDVTVTCKATETNMLEATTVRMPWWLWVIIAVAIAGVAFAVYRLRRKKMPTAPTPPPEGS